MSLGVRNVGRILGNSLVFAVNKAFKIRQSSKEDTNSKELVHVFGLHGVGTGPDLRRLDGLDVEAGHNAKVTATSLQSPEQIRVGILVCVHNGAIGQNNLIVDDSVATEADLVAVEVDTASKEQTRNTNRAKTTTRNGDIVLGEICIDLAPSTNISSMVLCSKVRNVGLAGKRDQATARTCLGSVPWWSGWT